MRCFVVGNGPSLLKTPLERLQAEITFACNRIHLLYNETSWRPTYYARFEPHTWAHDSDVFFEECQLHIKSGEKCIFPHWEEELGTHANVEYINTCHHYKYAHTHKKFPRSLHLPMLCDVNGITALIQLAHLKGFDEIYLVGCDLDGGHFTDAYRGAVETERWRKCHELICDGLPAKVYNATLGGSLEVYPRVNLEEIL